MRRDSKIEEVEALMDGLKMFTTVSEFLFNVSCDVLFKTTSFHVFKVDEDMILSLLT